MFAGITITKKYVHCRHIYTVAEVLNPLKLPLVQASARYIILHIIIIIND